ncbi:hypothetical protein [Methylobacterium nigriterrae]|uniref:hypothetical protein n=1 Tax=Methylobacterium nigriterrae TaxID=3127512 RepID=UPI0030133C84
METLLILAAVVACAAVGVMAVSMTRRARRPPMRMPHDLDDDDTDMLIGSLGRPESPIDRTAPILDLEPLEPRPEGRGPGGRPDASR